MSRSKAMPAKSLAAAEKPKSGAIDLQHEIVAAISGIADPLETETPTDIPIDMMPEPVDLHANNAAKNAPPTQPPEPQMDPTASPEAEVAALAALSHLNYKAARAEAAKRLGINRGDLDRAVDLARRTDRASRAAAARAMPLPKLGEVRWPVWLKVQDDGLYYQAGKEEPPLWLSSRFDVLGEARRPDGTGWALALRWCDRDGRLVVWVMPWRLLMIAPGELEARMVDLGLRINPEPMARLQLRKALGEVRSGTTVTIVDRAGWHATPGAPNAYVLPNGETLGDTGEDLMMAGLGEEASRRCSTAGTLAGWRAGVAVKAIGNPVAVFAMACAFTGPLLQPLKEVSGGFHLAGGSKGGKTTACKVAATVWGPPQKGAVLRDWHSTGNAVEAMAEEAGDGLLVLDEIHQADPSSVVGTVYALAGEGGKSRLKEDATARRRRTWRIFILSTGEIDLTSVAARAGQRLPAGAAVRLPSIPVEKGGEAWPNLHGAADFADFMSQLHAAMQAHHGHAARAFIDRLAREWSHATMRLVARFEAARHQLDALLPKNAEAQARDVARRFALVATAGELATEWRVTGWPVGEAIRAAESQMRAWLAAQGGGAAEDAEALERVRHLIAEHGESRFPLSNEEGEAPVVDGRPAVRRAGFRKPINGEMCYLVFPEVWSREIFAGADATMAARTLQRVGFLMAGEDGKLQRKARVPGLPVSTRFYVVREAIMGSE